MSKAGDSRAHHKVNESGTGVNAEAVAGREALLEVARCQVNMVSCLSVVRR